MLPAGYLKDAGAIPVRSEGWEQAETVAFQSWGKRTGSLVRTTSSGQASQRAQASGSPPAILLFEGSFRRPWF